MDHEEKFLMSECKHTPLCIVQETHDKLRVEELEKAPDGPGHSGDQYMRWSR